MTIVLKGTKADELREKAQSLLRMAAKIEEKKNLELGKLVRTHHRTNFSNFDDASFKSEVSRILEG